MKKKNLTLGCYQRVINLLGNGWMAKANNKEPPVGNIPSAALTQHDYDISKLSALFNTTQL
ncbi:hypothetical protein [Parabacteroides goldsteinii]|uniref:hypothetical protein n=1 Tax=Parabacteroides goldsteinii TaxID=328812 RepID=UPI0032B20F72